MAGTLSRAPTPRPALSASTSDRRQDDARRASTPGVAGRHPGTAAVWLDQPAPALRALAGSPDADATPAVKWPWPRPDGRCGPAARARSLRLSAGQAQTSG